MATAAVLLIFKQKGYSLILILFTGGKTLLQRLSG